MQTLCLTGWQQARDALEAIAPGAWHFDYASYADCEKMFADLPREPDIAIGWSLGGQLLVRAVAGNYIKPKKLVLLAAAFQCVSDPDFAPAMPAKDFQATREQYAHNPSAMMEQFQAYAGFGYREIIKTLRSYTEIWPNGLYWLDELGRFSCRNLNFEGFPETIIIHGTGDKVTNPAQAEAFAARIPGSELILLPGWSHALHLHGPDVLRKIISV